MQNYQQRGLEISFLETQITHPSHAQIVDTVDGALFNPVQSGDPVLIGASLPGVATASAESKSDIIAVITGNVVRVPVAGGVGGLNVGDPVYIHAADATLSGTNTDVYFGTAIEPVGAGVTTYIAVKLRG